MSICLFVCLSVCVFVCLSVCLYQRISLTAEPIGFSLTVQLLIGPCKVYNYFLLKSKIIDWVIKFDSPLLKYPQRPLEAQPLVISKISLLQRCYVPEAFLAEKNVFLPPQSFIKQKDKVWPINYNKVTRTIICIYTTKL